MSQPRDAFVNMLVMTFKTLMRYQVNVNYVLLLYLNLCISYLVLYVRSQQQ